MCIDINPGWIHVQIQHKCRPPVPIQNIAITGAHRSRKQLVANRTPVEKHVLQVRLTARMYRAHQPAPQQHSARLALDVDRVFGELAPTNPANPVHQFSRRDSRWQIKDLTLIVRNPERNRTARQGDSLDHLADPAKFGALAAQETPPRRRIEEQVAHLDGGAGRMRSRTDAATATVSTIEHESRVC